MNVELAKGTVATVYDCPRTHGTFLRTGYVGWTVPEEWFNLTVQVAHAGVYRGDLLYTSNRGGSISLDVNGKPAGPPLPIVSTFNAADLLAAMATLEPWSKFSRAKASGGEECTHRAHSHGGTNEPGIF
jgi:hypothetical protein